MDVLRLFLLLLLNLLRGLGLATKALGRASLWLVRGVASLSGTDFRSKGALGTARWASRWELRRAGVYRGVGPVVGQSAFGRIMRYNSDGVVQVFAQTGSGKGLGLVIPTLLDYPGSIVVTDVKGENFAITARHRAKRGKVVVMEPSNLAHSAQFNPLDMIRAGTDDEQDDALMLADLMVLRDSADGHWSAKSISLLAAFILHALHDRDPVNRTLAHVNKLTRGEPHAMTDRIRDIALNSPAPLAQSIAQGFLGSMGKPGEPTPEFSAILSDLHKASEPWTEGTPTGRLSARSTFQLEELTGKTPVTLYLRVDEEKLRSYARWLRVMTGLTVAALMRAKKTGKPPHKVVLLLDEAFVLGRLDVLANNLGLLRAYCTPMLIWQSMPQVRDVYGAGADAFLANASCKVYFGVPDVDTAHQVSVTCGQTQIRTKSQGVSQASDVWLRENRSQGESDSGYWLIDPSEVMRLPPTRVIIKMRHVAFPILTWRADYRTRWRWKLRWDHWDPSASSPVKPAAPVPPPAPPRGPSLPLVAPCQVLFPVGTTTPPQPNAAPW